MNYPLVSIVIATFNSEKTLPLVLKSIRKQTYPRDKIEILLVDGGSTDKTLEIAKKFSYRIISNPRTEPVYGKFLGYLKARGKYVMYLDHDEVIKNKNSINLKLRAFRADKRIRAVVGSGYETPSGYPFINDYINEFGDPFSFFIYRLSKDTNFFAKTMMKRYLVVLENKFFTIFDFSKAKDLPIIELVAGGSMFDSNFFRKKFPQIKKRQNILPHLFYLLHSERPFIAIIKKDILIHYSADSIKKYLSKIQWRVKNNIYHVSSIGAAGFTGREKFQPLHFRLKKYLFIPYAYSIVVPLIDSIWLAVSRRKPLYFLHLPLTIYTANLILYHSLLKIMGAKPKLTGYGESKKTLL